LTQFSTGVNDKDFIPVDDAVVDYAVSRSTLFRLIRNGQLSRFRRVGDRKSYLSRAQLQEVLSFKAKEAE
jgi:hypothetical protein